MSGLFDSERGWGRAVNKIVDCICLNLLFLLTCIPIFTIGASFTALYYTMQKTIKNERGYMGTEYWNAFKTNFKQSTLLWLVLLVVGVVLGMDVWVLYFMNQGGSSIGKAYIFFAILIILEFLWIGYLFPYIARFQNTTRAICKNAAVMAILNFPKTILELILMAVGALVVYFIPIAIIIVPVICTWIQSNILEKIFRKYMSEEDKATEDERNQNYKK